jgi:hypothetical protein
MPTACAARRRRGGWKPFGKQRQLLLQDLKRTAYPILAPMYAGQDQVIARLEAKGPINHKLMMLVRRNSRSVLPERKRIWADQLKVGRA